MSSGARAGGAAGGALDARRLSDHALERAQAPGAALADEVARAELVDLVFTEKTREDHGQQILEEMIHRGSRGQVAPVEVVDVALLRVGLEDVLHEQRQLSLSIRHGRNVAPLARMAPEPGLAPSCRLLGPSLERIYNSGAWTWTNNR